MGDIGEAPASPPVYVPQHDQYRELTDSKFPLRHPRAACTISQSPNQRCSGGNMHGKHFGPVLAVLLFFGSVTEAPAQDPKSTNVSITTPGGDTVTGVLLTPANPQGPAPGVIVLHTAGGRVKSGDIWMAKVLATNGFNALAINYNSAWFARRLENPVHGAIAWFESQPIVAGKPIGIVGFSAGGMRALWLTAQNSKIKAVVNYYGLYDYADSPIGKCPGVTPGTPSVYSMVQNIRAPVLMLHGDKDPEVPLHQIQRMKDLFAAQGTPADAVVYPGAHHGFDRGREDGMNSAYTSCGSLLEYNKAHEEDARKRTVAWFKEHLK